MSRSDRTWLTGWGGTSPTVSRVIRPETSSRLSSVLAGPGSRGVIVRGLGRSYGDPAQNAGGAVIDLTGWDAVEIDSDGARVRAAAGASITQLHQALLPRGLCLPVVPGTSRVTVGGAVCADVHGKNHHVRGSFGSHVTSLSMLLSSGDVVEATPDGRFGDLFWATVGGMGLTGVVLEATIDLDRIEAPFAVVDTERATDVHDLLAALAAHDEDTFSVAWFDAAATGDALGRGVVYAANPAKPTDLDSDERSQDRELVAPARWRVPVRPPFSLVNRFTATGFNAVRYASAPRRRTGEIQHIARFLHPLDTLADWNRLYGPRGFCQYQFVIPFTAKDVLVDVVRTTAESGHVSGVTVLKRLGPANRSPLSFPMPGWTVAFDLPVRRGLDVLLDHLDQLVVSAGGRIYLAKDARADAATIAHMYPRLDEFRAIRAHYDPRRTFRSDLSRRLEL